MKSYFFKLCCFAIVVIFASSCAVQKSGYKSKRSKIPVPLQKDAQRDHRHSGLSKKLKRRIAVARFTNETQYGKAFLYDEDLDVLGKQASDILSSKLVETENFIVLERDDLAKLKQEQAIAKKGSLIGAQSVILGSITEFGRKTISKKGLLSATKMQQARAAVELRLVDVTTGHAYFSVSGVGTAEVEASEIAGFGESAEYDATLNDKAISAAIDSVISGLIEKLEEKPWQTQVLEYRGGKVYIAAGKSQGVMVGNLLTVQQKGRKIKNQETGFVIDMPSKTVAQIKVTGLFGKGQTNEGSVAKIVKGSKNVFRRTNLKNLIITE